MTNEEVIDYIEKWKTDYSVDAKDREVLSMAIKALEQQPCEDCISREAVIKHICESKECYKDECKGRLYKRCFDLQWIYDLSSVTPKPKIGKWIILDECANEGVYCSECHKKVFKLEYSHTMKWRNFKYCPNCGAKMEVEE